MSRHLLPRIGEHVVLRPAQSGLEPFVAQVVGRSCGHGIPQHIKVRWYYRPGDVAQETELPTDLLANEVFYTTETDEQPVDSVESHCAVKFCGLGDSPDVTEATESGPVFICRREYIPMSREILPLRHGAEVGKKLPQIQTTTIVEEGFNEGTPSSRKKRRKAAPPEASSDGLPQLHPQINKSTSPMASRSPKRSHSSTSGRPDDVHPRHDLAIYGLSTASPSGSGPSTVEDADQIRSFNRGRWSAQRYEAGQEALVKILHEMGAVSGMTAVLRPVLRETARKVIGDTGLLDHLLKHMADQIVSAEGDFLRRRHNKEGHMVYWLQSSSQAELAGELLKDEVSALSSELQELKEARHALSAAKAEAVQALEEVAPLTRGAGLSNDGSPAVAVDNQPVPSSPFGRSGIRDLATLPELQARVEGIAAEMTTTNSSLLAGMEDIRCESAGLARMAGEQIHHAISGIESLAERQSGLETLVLQLEEAGRGRLEALVTAVHETLPLRQRVENVENRLSMIELVVLSLRADMAAIVTACRELPFLESQLQVSGVLRSGEERKAQTEGQGPRGPSSHPRTMSGRDAEKPRSGEPSMTRTTSGGLSAEPTKNDARAGSIASRGMQDNTVLNDETRQLHRLSPDAQAGAAAQNQMPSNGGNGAVLGSYQQRPPSLPAQSKPKATAVITSGMNRE